MFRRRRSALDVERAAAAQLHPQRPRLAVIALSADGVRHASMRCFMRESVSSLTLQPSLRGGWSAVLGLSLIHI